VVSRYGFRDPALPSALASAVRFSRDGRTGSQLSGQSNPLVELGLPPERCPAIPSLVAAATGSSRELLFPSAHAGFDGPRQGRALRCRAGVPHPASFRLQGLVTLLTACSRRNRADLVSCRQRSWDSPFGAFSSDEVETRFRASGPTCRFSRQLLTFAEAKGRPDGPRLLGFRPRSESLACKRAMNPRTAGCSPGLSSFRASRC
jgi:hypothetical protein